VNSFAQVKQGKWLMQIESTLGDEIASNSP
jgi:hypothetical protein